MNTYRVVATPPTMPRFAPAHPPTLGTPAEERFVDLLVRVAYAIADRERKGGAE